jgi:hypothetical protein
MSPRPRQWRVNLAFEPNRFSAEALSTVDQQLKPVDSRAVTSEAPRQTTCGKRLAQSGGRS